MFVVVGVTQIMVDPSTKSVLVGASLVLFFGGCAVVFAFQLRDTRPRIIIDDRGVFDRTLRVGVIPWDQILGAHARRGAGQWFIALTLRDPQEFVRKLGSLHRRLVGANEVLGFEVLNLNLTAVAADPDALAERVTQEAALRREATQHGFDLACQVAAPDLGTTGYELPVHAHGKPGAAGGD